MNGKKKFSLCNVSDSLSDREMKQVKGGWFSPPDIVSCCMGNDPLVRCSNQWGQYFYVCSCDAPAFAGAAYDQCAAATQGSSQCLVQCTV